MKRIIYMLLVATLTLQCCQRVENETLLCQLCDIQAMGDTLPRFAIKRLDSIKPLFVNETEYMRNKYALLNIRLRDKAYITHTTDDTIKEICKYFEKHGTAKDLQEAYYYMGSVYRDMKDSPNAVTYFLKSAYIAENNENEVDYLIWENTHSQLSYIYNMQFDYHESLEVALKGLVIAEKYGSADSRTYMNIASSFFRLRDTIQTIKYTDISLGLIEREGISVKNADIVASAINKYSLFGYKERAERCIWLLEELPEGLRPFNYSVNLSTYHELYTSIDSAAVINTKLFNRANSIEAKYDASQWLTRYYTAKCEYEKASEYAIKFIAANEIVIKKRNFEHTTNAKNIFQYRRDKEEELEIMQKAAKDRFYLTVVILVSIIILLAGIVLYYYRKKRLLDIILEKENSIKEIHVLIEQKNCELIAGKDEVERKQKELELLAEKNSNLAMQLQGAKSDFKMLIAQNSELTKLTLMNNISCDAKEIINKVKNASVGKYRLNDDEWKELFGAIDKLYPDFTYEVQAKFKKIGEPLLRVCYLLKIGLSGPQIVNLTDYPRQTVWDRIKRVEKVITFNPVGLPSQQDSQD